MRPRATLSEHPASVDPDRDGRAESSIRGPVIRSRDGRLKSNPRRPASLLNEALLLDCLDAVRDHARGDLLDLGCGEKPYEWIFGSQVRRYIGCDWSATPHSLRHVDLLADAARLPFPDATFDTVLCTELLEHVLDPVRCVLEVRRVLRPGGTLILTTPFFYWVHEAPHDYYRYTPYALRSMVHRAGLEVVDFRTRGNVITVVIDVWSKWAHNILRRFGRRGWPGRVVSALLGWTVTLPQHAYLGCRGLAHRLGVRPAWFSRSVAFAENIALGYVLVAQLDRVVERPGPDSDDIRKVR